MKRTIVSFLCMIGFLPTAAVADLVVILKEPGKELKGKTKVIAPGGTYKFRTYENQIRCITYFGGSVRTGWWIWLDHAWHCLRAVS